MPAEDLDSIHPGREVLSLRDLEFSNKVCLKAKCRGRTISVNTETQAAVVSFEIPNTPDKCDSCGTTLGTVAEVDGVRCEKCEKSFGFRNQAIVIPLCDLMTYDRYLDEEQRIAWSFELIQRNNTLHASRDSYLECLSRGKEKGWTSPKLKLARKPVFRSTGTFLNFLSSRIPSPASVRFLKTPQPHEDGSFETVIQWKGNVFFISSREDVVIVVCEGNEPAALLLETLLNA